MHQIFPQEFHVLADKYVIKTRCPQGELSEDMILKRVRAANLMAGDEITVLCMDHDYTTVLAKAAFIVSRCAESIERYNVGERNERTSVETEYKIAQTSDWWVSEKVAVKWNPGVKKHQVTLGEEVLFEGDKDEVEAFLKEKAA